MAAKPIKSLLFHYTTIQFLIKGSIQLLVTMNTIYLREKHVEEDKYVTMVIAKNKIPLN